MLCRQRAPKETLGGNQPAGIAMAESEVPPATMSFQG